jgi:hypothetical protein
VIGIDGLLVNRSAITPMLGGGLWEEKVAVVEMVAETFIGLGALIQFRFHFQMPRYQSRI